LYLPGYTVINRSNQTVHRAKALYYSTGTF